VLENKIKILPIVNFLALIMIVFFYVHERITKKEEIVYVDNVKLFDNFQMTRELKSIGEKEYKFRKNEIDSIYSKLQIELNSQEKEGLMKMLISKREEFDYFNQNYSTIEAEKIWSRIDSYVKAYSEENKFKIIISSSSTRDVLYAEKEIDITQELTEYINKKYEGFK
jgi:outer membrane protein